MTEEYTFSMIKPDATKRNIIGQVIKYIEDSGLSIVAQKGIKLTKQQAELFYAEHIEKPFFNNLVQSITSGPVIIQVLKGPNAIAKNRQTMGHTNPAAADKGTIRGDLGESIEKNTVHGSDSRESAEREISLFFAKFDLIG